MAGRYENHIVVAEFDLRIKSGQILAVSTFKQKLSEIESRFNYNYKDKATLVLKELQTILIESVVLDNNPEPYLIIKGAEHVCFQLVVDEPVTEDELAKKKLELIARIHSIHFLRDLISSGDLSYENLNRAIQKTSDPKFLKKVIRNQEMPRMDIRIDSEKYLVESFEIPKEWRGGDPFTLSNYKVDKVGRKGDVCLHMLDENIGESRIGDDPFIWVEVETSTITYEALKLASSMGLPVSVDLIKMRKTRKNYPHYKLLALHNLDQILEGVKKEVADFEEKLSFL